MQACRYRPISGTMDTPLGFGDNSCWWTLTNVALSKSCPALSVSVYCWANRRKPGSVQLWPAFALMCPWPHDTITLCVIIHLVDFSEAFPNVLRASTSLHFRGILQYELPVPLLQQKQLKIADLIRSSVCCFFLTPRDRFFFRLLVVVDQKQ